MTILLRRITFLGLSHVSDSSESSYVAKDNMTFSGKLMKKSLDGLSSLLKLRFERHSRVSLIRNISPIWRVSKSVFWPKSHHWWLVSCFGEVGSEICACLRSSSFRTSSLKACGQWKWIVFSWPFTLSAVWFPVYDSVVSWMTVNCNRLIRSPNSALEFVMSVLRLPWSR